MNGGNRSLIIIIKKYKTLYENELEYTPLHNDTLYIRVSTCIPARVTSLMNGSNVTEKVSTVM